MKARTPLLLIKRSAGTLRFLTIPNLVVWRQPPAGVCRQAALS